MDRTPIGIAVHRLAAGLALLGGIALVVVTATTVLSIVGRVLIPLGLKPIPGDVELVQAAMLFTILAFMPWCHLTRGHTLVAILTDRFPVRINAALEFIWDIAMLGVAIFITWRFSIGFLDKLGNHEATFILHIPLWWIYGAGMVGLVGFVVVAAYCLVGSCRNAFSSDPVPPVGGGAE